MGQALDKQAQNEMDCSTALENTGFEGAMLIVDDESIVLRLQKRFFERRGIRVYLAESGHTAIQLYRKNRAEISFVLLDLVMPVMDGEATFYALRDINPDLPILLCSGYRKAETVERLLRNGALGFTQKPIDPADLLTALQKY